MNLYEITFQLNESEKIVIKFGEQAVMMNCCHEVPIFFVGESERLQIDCDSIRSCTQHLQSLLMKALNNELQLHKSVQNNIGYLYTQYKFYWYDSSILETMGFVFEDNKGKKRWVGKGYLLFAHDVAVWIYNDSKEDIVLEFTPWYTGNNFDEEGETDFTQYDAFLKEYKSLFTRIIPRDVAQQWLDQANQILQQIADNVERLAKEEVSE